VRAPPSPRARGRPKRNTHSTYATNDEDHLEEEPVIEEQPSASEVQDPTPDQELQQLQAQLQSMQQERESSRGLRHKLASGSNIGTSSRD
jgi:hypothetical protein